MKRKLTQITLAGFVAFGSGLALAQEIGPAKQTDQLHSAEDSLLLDYSVEELLQLRHSYQQEMEYILSQKDLMRDRGIRVMEFVVDKYPDSPALDKILVRLAGLHYEKAVKEYAAKLDSYQTLVAAAEAKPGDAAEVPAEPELDYSRSIELYQRVIDEFTGSPFVEDALYNKAFLLEDSGQRQEAAETYSLLSAMYPDGRYTPEALMRTAEYYFGPPAWDTERAIADYAKVLAFKDSPMYDAALYRLGWAYYKINDFPSAISYFTILADDIDAVRPWDPAVKHHFPAVRDEAVEYIGISFLDFGGAPKAAYYFDKIGGRGYGYDVFKKIGDAFMDVKEEYAEAVHAFEFLLAMYPDHANAPYIQARIAQAYRNLENEQMLVESRKKLFLDYGVNESWGLEHSRTENEKAQQLAEAGLRQNVDLLFKQGKDHDDPQSYAEAVGESKAYLQTFPLDSNAALIHWNMALALDTKLNQKAEAFDEYLKISKLYVGNRLQENAAENAIAIANEWVQADTAGVPDEACAECQAEAAGGQLTPNEQKLIIALNNYVRFFPHDEQTPKMLSRAGLIYYGKGQYKESVRYFKTLAMHFPNSEEMNRARLMTMESYFGKRDFESTENIAKKIRATGSEYTEQANQRLAEAIFRKAQIAADSAQHNAAATEYLRVVQEVPGAQFADLALFNAALEFEKTGNYQEAINSYEHLVAEHPNSEHRLSAFNNLAFDYRELKDYAKAGDTYERLFAVETNDSTRQEALYNASVSYVEAEAWQQAIAVNNKFADRFPDSDEAAGLLFDNAAYHLKLNNVAAADAIYDRFTRKFPNSPKVLQASFHRGHYFKAQDDSKTAREHFAKVAADAEAFKKQGVDFDPFIVAEALFELAELDFATYEAIEFSAQTDLKERKAAKQALLTEIVKNYSKVIEFGTARLPEATYNIGLAYEEFASTWANQEIATADLNQRIVARNQITEEGSGLYERTVTAYKDAAAALDKFIARQQENPQPQAMQAANGSLAEMDSTLQSAQFWADKCRSKISENLFTRAELYETSVQELLNAPVPENVSALEALVYRQEVLNKLVLPLTQKIGELHSENLRESKALGLENEWVERSGAAISSTRNLVAVRNNQLSLDALSAFAEAISTIEEKIDKDAKAAETTIEQTPGLLELSKNLQLAAAHTMQRNLEQIAKPEAKADSSYIAETEHQLLHNTLVYAQRADSLALAADRARQYYEQLFADTEKLPFEDAYFTFDEAFFTLQDASRELLELGFAASHFVAENNRWLQTFTMELLQKNPEEYSRKFGLTIDSKFLTSSTAWLSSSQEEDGWNQATFVDEHWHAAQEKAKVDALAGQQVRSIWHATSLNLENQDREHLDSLSVNEIIAAANQSTAADTAYFRRTFEVAGLPVSASMKLEFENPVQLFVNGRQVLAGESGSMAIEFELTNYIQLGRNVIAVRASKGELEQPGLESLLEVRFITDWTAMVDGRFDFTELPSTTDETEGISE